jgi:hypothetical protein
MSGFTAASAVTALDFDFTGAPRQDGTLFGELKGVIPEPTDERLAGYFTALGGLSEDAIAAVEAGEDANAAAVASMRAAVTAFCAGTPSAEDIAQFPPRYLAAFTRWITSELGGGDPKA